MKNKSIFDLMVVVANDNDKTTNNLIIHMHGIVAILDLVVRAVTHVASLSVPFVGIHCQFRYFASRDNGHGS